MLSLGGLYFTVIPLYQKALLDEAIARKEIELQQTQVALNKAYVSVRQIVIQQFVFLAVEKCSRTSRLLVSPDETPVEKKAGPKSASEDSLLRVDVKECIADSIAGTKSLSDLRPEDRSMLEARAKHISESLVSLREHSIHEFDSMPTTVQANPSRFKLKADFRSRMLDFLASHRPLEEIQRQRKELLVAQAQEGVSARYHQALLEHITSVRRLDWPSEKPNAR